MKKQKKMSAKQKLNAKIDSHIDEGLASLHEFDPSSEEYERIVSNTEKLNGLKDENKININTVLQVGGSIAVCAMAIGFEKFGGGLFPWKIGGFMPKGK